MGEYWCGRCKTKMISLGGGYYECPTCQDDPALLDDDDYDSLYEEKPDCCKACDGDTYPDCMGGCPLIDE